jgi:hypothetical protein
MVAHGGTSVAGSFIQTLTMVDVATDGSSACRWSIVTGASSSSRSSADKALRHQTASAAGRRFARAGFGVKAVRARRS